MEPPKSLQDYDSEKSLLARVEALGKPTPGSLQDAPQSISTTSPRGEALTPSRNVTPAPWDPRASSPELAKEVARIGDTLFRAPESPVTTTPASIRPGVRVQVGDVDVRVGSSFARKLLPWLAPLLLTVVGAVLGSAKGYFEGMAAAGRRVAAVEEGLRLNGEGDARLETRTRKEIDRVFVVVDDHDSRIPKIEKRLDKVEERLPKIEGIAPK